MPPKLAAALTPLVLLGTFAAPQPPQKQPDKPLPGDEMIYRYLCTQTDQLSARFLEGAKTGQDWLNMRPRLHREYLDMLGLWPLPEKTPLKATVTGTFEHEGVVVENLHFQSKPGLYVTANLYRPKAPPAKKLPAVLYVCGHADKGRDGNKSAHQDHGMWFASNGYVCLVLDSLQLGEIVGVHHGTYGDPYRHLRARGDKSKVAGETRGWWYSAGYTPAGVECWNGVRAIDYLTSRDDVDAERIGVTGISGGGAATFWIAAADDRVKVAVPVSGMSDLISYVKDKVVNGHCDCMFLYNTYQWDWTTIAALIAPRPLLFANSDADPIFPMDGNRRIMAKLNKLYRMLGKPDLVDEYVSRGGHAYRPDLRVAVFRFMNKHLHGETAGKVKDVDFTPIEGKQLRVFPTDDDIPRDAINGKIDETFVPRAKVPLPKKGEFAEWKKGLLAALKERPLRGLPEPLPLAKQLRSFKGITEDYSSEPGIEFSGMTLFFSPEGKDWATLVVVNVDDDAFEQARTWTKLFKGEKLAYAMYPRGGPGHNWQHKSPPNTVERSLALLGQTSDLGRLTDVLAMIRLQRHRSPEGMKLRLAGKGNAGILAAYAALLSPGLVDEVVLIDPPTSHVDGPQFLGVLRVLDVPDTLGMLAPTPLTLIGAKGPAFDRVEEIYKIAGAGDKLTRK
jgi:dienelactone hydrolase